METSITPGKDLRSKVGKIAMAIGFAFVIGGVGVGPTLAGGRGNERGDRGRDRGRQNEERHDNDRNENQYRNDYYARPNYYYDTPPNYYYAPPPVYYDEPTRSQGWTFIFPF